MSVRSLGTEMVPAAKAVNAGRRSVNPWPVTAFDPTQPFILFDDARGAAPVRLYRDEVARIEAYEIDDVVPAMTAVRAALAQGRHVAGAMAYAAGGAFEPRLATQRPLETPLVSFGVYERAHMLDWQEVEAWVAQRGVDIGPLSPHVTQAQHAAAVARILEYIHAGDIYQANLTLGVSARYRGHPLALYARLRRAQRMPHGALAHQNDGSWILSASPELFFAVSGGMLTARPMKGTERRQAGARADKQAAAALAEDVKNRAENLMITDLIRNDLSRVASAGSVRVEAPFAVERYPTVHQMVTTVKAQMAPGHDAIDVLTSMFPCGSITGAPKIRACEVIEEVEWRARGIYTGTIGWLEPGGDAAFNVAIRTAELRQGRLTMGVGAGIVADSDATLEWQETLTKASFLNMPARAFHLIETMRFDPEDGIAFLDLHLDRLAASAERFDFKYNRHQLRNMLQIMIGRERRRRRVKLTLSRDGSHAFSISPPPPAAQDMTVRVVPLPVDEADWRLFHKTSDRVFYDQARVEAGTDEVLFARRDGLLTEGSFTNIFVERDGKFLTPRAESGLLPGVLRESMLARHEAVEADLTAEDLQDGFLVGNAVRGLIPAKLVAAQKDGA